MEWLALLISLIACVIGAISGIGGGLIIRPALDTAGIFSLDAIGFLSGCTVLAMAVVSVWTSFRNPKSENPKQPAATLLGIGAAIGGAAGRILSDIMLYEIGSDAISGIIQSVLLLIIVTISLIYTIYSEKIRTHHITSHTLIITCGFLLGTVSAFLGIGGGPLHIVLLAYLFSMNPKQAAINSLYIILISQLAALAVTTIGRSIPDVDPVYLAVMVIGGITGALAGRAINSRLTHRSVTRIFQLVMVFVIAVCIVNFFKYLIMV